MRSVASTLDSLTLDFYRGGLEAPSDVPAESIAILKFKRSASVAV